MEAVPELPARPRDAALRQGERRHARVLGSRPGRRAAQSRGLILALAFPLALAAAEVQTWNDANKESARILREQGPTVEAADLARRAFELYGEHALPYHERTHAQLILNAVDAQLRAGSVKAALELLDEGALALAAKAGSDAPLLLQLWQEGIRIARHGGADHEQRTDTYYERATSLARKHWGNGDARHVVLQVEWAKDLRHVHGRAWARRKLQEARELALPGGPMNPVVVMADIALATLHAEGGDDWRALKEYRAIVDRLESAGESADPALLQNAYALLEYSYERARRRDEAAEIRKKLVALFGEPDRAAIVPLVRVAPLYPRDAARRHREGFTDIEVVIGPDGRVRDAKIFRSEPPGLFDQASLAVIRKWRFAPKVVDGVAVEQRALQRIEYRMERR